ncbi:MAG: thioredoxin-like domain-containing protein [Bacteroidota bacterium]
MKYHLLFIACWIGGLSGLFAQSGYKVDLEVEGFTEAEAYLAYYFGDKQYIKDTTAVKDGKFTFAGEEALDGGIYLVVLPPDNQYFELVLDKDQHFSAQTKLGDFVPSMKIKGCRENEEFYRDIQFLGEQRTKATEWQQKKKEAAPGSPELAAAEKAIADIDKTVQAHREAFQKRNPDLLYTKVLQSMQEPQLGQAPEGLSPEEAQQWQFFEYRKHYFDNIDLADDRLLRTPILYNKVNTFIEKLTYQMPDSLCQSVDYVVGQMESNPDVFQFFVVNLLNKYAKSKVMGMDAVYVCMVEKYYMSGKAFWSDSAQVAKMTERALAISPTIVGRVAPNFRVQDSKDNWQHLHGLTGDYVILYFWDYDCGHCKKVTPKLAEAYQAYKDKKVDFFALSINGDVGVWKEKIAEYGMEDAINVQDHYRKSGFDAMYDVRSTPRIFILDKDKKILAKQISVETLQEVLNRELGLAPPPSAEEEEEAESGKK